MSSSSTSRPSMSIRAECTPSRVHGPPPSWQSLRRMSTGALCAAILDRGSPSSVVGVEPSDGFLATAKQNLAGRATLHRGTASAIPLDDASIDVVVSGLVLNFVPDQPAALVEMERVANKGGTIAAYAWDYAGKMELMRIFWDAAVELDPDAAKLDERVRFPLCRPEALESLFAGAGLAEVEVGFIDVPTPFTDFEDYWRPFLGGQGPAPSYAMSLWHFNQTVILREAKFYAPAFFACVNASAPSFRAS